MIVFPQFHNPVYLHEKVWESLITSRIRHEEIPGISHKIPVLPNRLLLLCINWPWGRIDDWLLMTPVQQEPQKQQR